MTWTTLTTARHFNSTPEAKKYLIENGVNIRESEYGGTVNDVDLHGDKLEKLLEGVDAIISGAVHLSREVIFSSKHLKCISRRGLGYDMVDVKSATEKGVAVTITPGTIEIAVADHIFALMLGVSKRILDGHNCIKAGKWQAFMGTELYRKTLGIIGLGRIGKGVAKRSSGFEMRILAFDMHQDLAFAEQYGVSYVELDQLLSESDFVCICAPLNESTHHMIGRSQLAIMKETAILVNAARGGLINESDLIQCLLNKKIAGAGMDVFEHEPLVCSQLTEIEAVLLSPHCAGYTQESMSRANLKAAENVVSVLNNKMLSSDCIVNPEALSTGGKK